MMAKIEGLPDYLNDFLEAGALAYGKYFPNADEAFSVFVEMVLTEYIVSRLSGLISRKQLIELQSKPEKLFAYAAGYLRKRLVEFDEGQKANSGWTEDETKK